MVYNGLITEELIKKMPLAALSNTFIPSTYSLEGFVTESLEQVYFYQYQKAYHYNIKNIGSKIINIENYFLYFFLFKYIILKDLIYRNYKKILTKYFYNFYKNKSFCRFFYLFIRIIVINIILHIDLLKVLSSNFFNKLNFFFYNNLLFINVYNYIYNINFLYFFNKFKFYKNIKLLSKIFFINEFYLNIDKKSYFLYKNYINDFKFFKYREYLSNNRLL
jgi:hypothetical protein